MRMMRTAVLVAIGMSGVGRAESLPIQAEAIGIGLESYPYPFPVELFPLEIEGQMVRMAYMDVRPTAAGNGQTVVLLHGKNFYGNSWEGPEKEAFHLEARRLLRLITPTFSPSRSGRQEVHR